MLRRSVPLFLVVLVLVALVVAACGGGGGAAPQPQGDANAGGQAWAKSCASCHGANAEGSIGPKLAGTPLPFDTVKNTVRNGRGAGMPKFSADQVSDADIANIYAWLKSK